MSSSSNDTTGVITGQKRKSADDDLKSMSRNELESLVISLRSQLAKKQKTFSSSSSSSASSSTASSPLLSSKDLEKLRKTLSTKINNAIKRCPVKSHSAKPKVEVIAGMSLATLQSLLGGKEDDVFTLTKDTKSLYVADIRMVQRIFPTVSIHQQAVWKGKSWGFAGQSRGKVMCNVAFEAFTLHFKKKESLLTIKMKVYQPRGYYF